MKKIFTREITMGLILFISLAVLFFGIDYLKGINVFKMSNLYYASFSDVTGLTVATPVTINGYKVGQVTDIQYQYDKPGQIAVEIDMDKNFKLTKGSKLQLSTSVLGTAMLTVDMAPGNEFISNTDTIPGERAGDLMAELSTDVIPAVIDMLPKLNSILAHVDTLVSNPALEKSITRLDGVSRNLEVLSKNLAVTSGKIDPVIANAGDITADLAQISGDLKVLSAELKNIPLKETMQNVETTTSNLAQITGKVNSKDSSLGMLLNDKGLYNHIDATIVSLDSIIVDLRKNPKKYVNFKLF